VVGVALLPESGLTALTGAAFFDGSGNGTSFV
jgi:hypothetical protein